MTEVSSGDKFRAGVHYEIVDNPTTVRDPSKIEVTEVFWFGCNHCYALEPYIARWKKDVPGNLCEKEIPSHLDISKGHQIKCHLSDTKLSEMTPVIKLAAE